MTAEAAQSPRFPRREVGDFFTDEVTVNENGGRQSAVPVRLDLVDPFAILSLGKVLAFGAKHGEENWRNISAREHVNHALAHLMGWLAGDSSEPHLGHAFCRLMMAVAVGGA